MESTATPTNSSSQQCTSCDGSTASGWCLQCDEALCDSCVAAHRRVTITRSHSIVNQPPAGVFTAVTRFCHLHPSEPLKLFCHPCKQLTCRDCQLISHKNHRYQFVNEALDSLKQQMASQLQPIIAQKEAISRSLQEMDARLQQIEEEKFVLKEGLQRTFLTYARQFKNRMVQLFSEIKTVCQHEVDAILRRREELKKLEEKQHWLAQTAEEAKNTDSLYDLLTYTSQVEAQVRELSNQVTSPPSTMNELKVMIDTQSYKCILSIGDLVVSAVPFSVSQSASQNTPAVMTGNTLTAASSSSSSSSSSSAGPLITPHPPHPPLPHYQKPYMGNTSNTGSAGPANHLSAPCQPSSNWSIPPRPSCQNLYLSSTPVTLFTSASSPHAVQHPSTSAATTNHNQLHLGLPPNQNPASLQPVVQANYSQSCMLASSPSQSCAGLQPSLVLNQPHSVPVTAALLTNTQTVMYQTSCSWPANLVQLPSQHRALPYSLPRNNHQTGASEQKNYMAANSSQFNPVPVNQQPPAFKPRESMNVHQRQSSSVTGNHSQTGQASVQQATGRSHRGPSVQGQPSAIKSFKPAQMGKDIPPRRWSYPDTEKQRQSSRHQSCETSSSQHTSVCTALRRSEMILKTSPLLSDLLQNKAAVPSTDHHIHETRLNTQTHNDPLQTTCVQNSGNPHEIREALIPPDHRPVSDANQDSASGRGDPSPPQHQQPSQIVKAIADSACDLSMQQPGDSSAAVQQEPGENEPTSTVSEEPCAVPSECRNISEVKNMPVPSPESEPEETDFSVTLKTEALSLDETLIQYFSSLTQTETSNLQNEGGQEDKETSRKSKPSTKPSQEISSREDEELSCVEGALSLKQVTVSLFRLPIPAPPAGESFPLFRLVPGDSRDELFIQEINEDSKLHVDDFMEPVSSPESPAPLRIVICCACGCANSSLVCAACGRGFHRDCHIPVMGSSHWPEWICSLCQDLTDPSDPYSSERRRRPSLDLLQQRKCENLLLNLLVEGCAELCLPSELPSALSQLNVMSERLARSWSPPYRTPAEVVSDIWTLFENASTSQENQEVLPQLEQHFQKKLLKHFGNELHPSLLKRTSIRNTEPESRTGSPNVNNTWTETEETAERPEGSKFTSTLIHSQTEEEEEEVIEDSEGSEVTPASNPGLSKLKETRKRLRDFLDTMGSTSSKKSNDTAECNMLTSDLSAPEEQ